MARFPTETEDRLLKVRFLMEYHAHGAVPYGRFLNEYADKVKKQLSDKFKAENPALTDAVIAYYIGAFEKRKSSPKITEKDIFKYTFKELETLIDRNFPGEKPSSPDDDGTETVSGGDTIYNADGLTILLGDTKEKCVRYGKGHSWCISRTDSSNMFHSYRYRSDEPVFYFVLDAAKPETDKYRAMVIYVDSEGGYHVADATNSGDQHISWGQIERIQPNLMGLRHLFKHIPLTASERAEHELLREPTGKPDLVAHLGSYDMAGKYIAIGHELTAWQFQALPDDLKLKYINLGHIFIWGWVRNAKPAVRARYAALLKQGGEFHMGRFIAQVQTPDGEDRQVLIDERGNELTEHEYDWIGRLDTPATAKIKFEVLIDDKWGFIGLDGKELGEGVVYGKVYRFDFPGIFMAQIGKLYYMVGSDGIRFGRGYDDIYSPSDEGIFVVSLAGKTCLVDRTGREVSAWYDSIGEDVSGIWRVTGQDGRQGYVGPDGKPLGKGVVYQYAWGFKNNYGEVIRDGIRLSVDREGNEYTHETGSNGRTTLKRI